VKIPTLIFCIEAQSQFCQFESKYCAIFAEDDTREKHSVRPLLAPVFTQPVRPPFFNARISGLRRQWRVVTVPATNEWLAAHTMMVTLVGQEILRGRHISGVTPHDWLHFIISLLGHDIGYVRGICRGDGDGSYVINLAGDKMTLPEGRPTRQWHRIMWLDLNCLYANAPPKHSCVWTLHRSARGGLLGRTSGFRLLLGQRLKVVGKVLCLHQPLIHMVFWIARDHVAGLRRTRLFCLQRTRSLPQGLRQVHTDEARQFVFDGTE
jgi:hypothetical protein